MRDTITESEWEIWLETGETPIYKKTSPNEFSPEFCGLESLTCYRARTRYHGSRYGWSDWSDFTPFCTPQFIKPLQATVKCGFEIYLQKASVQCGNSRYLLQTSVECGQEIWPLQAELICNETVTLFLEVNQKWQET